MKRATGRPLAGVRVVSIEHFISGPYCTQILADAGAEVVKVERPGTGDPRRGYAPHLESDGARVSSGFASYNRGKKSVTLDLASEAGREALEDLLVDADVLVSNLGPGSLERVVGGVEALRARLPRLIVCELSGFGVTGGPLANEGAFDPVIQALSGFAGLLGSGPADAPSLAPMSTMDLLTGVWAAAGIAMALASRSRTGEGMHVDAAMLDVGAALIERPLTLYEFTGVAPRAGSDDYSPVGTFRAADGGAVAIVVPTDAMWLNLCAGIGDPGLRDDPRLATVRDRARQMGEIVIPAIEAWARRDALGADAAATRLRDAGLPAGPVATVDQVRRSEQLAHREFFSPLEVAGGDGLDRTFPHRLPRTPLVFDGIPPRPGSVPTLGQHDAEFGPSSERRSAS